MKYRIILLCFFLGNIVFSQYKYPKKEYADLVQQSTLVIELIDDDGERATAMNTALKEVFVEHWKTSSILFMTLPEIEALVTTKKDGYAILYQQNSSYEELRIKEDIYLNVDRNRPVFTFSYYECYLDILIDGKLRHVSSIGFGNENLGKEDYLFLYQQLSGLLSASASGKKVSAYFNVKKNMEKLKTSTLILPKQFFRKKDHDKIAKYYKYGYELVDWEEYEKTILKRQQGKSYVKIIWSFQHKLYMWVIVDAENGAIRAITSFGGIRVGNDFNVDDIIKAKHLKYATSKLAQKINNRY